MDYKSDSTNSINGITRILREWTDNPNLSPTGGTEQALNDFDPRETVAIEISDNEWMFYKFLLPTFSIIGNLEYPIGGLQLIVYTTD